MIPRTDSPAEDALAQELKWLKMLPHEREYRFSPPRRWRFDFAWPQVMVALEVEGGTFSGGRHTRGPAFERDCEKYNTALVQGWRVLRVTPHQITSGQAIAWLEQALLPW
jgi:very-short-patch-repair endonuclease